MRWSARVPARAGQEAGIDGLVMMGQTVTVAGKWITKWWSDDDGRWLAWGQDPPARTGVIASIFVSGAYYVITCDDVPEPQPVRHCDRCGGDIDASLWRDDDHGVYVTGPLSIESVATKATGESVRFRASQPYVIVFCSQFDRTLSALNPTQET